MKHSRIAKTLWIFALAPALIFVSLGYAQTTASQIQITLGLGSTTQSIGPTAPIPITISVKNVSASAVYTRQGFLAQDFHLKMTILDPDGLPVPLKYQAVAPAEPGPPYRVENMNVAFGEMIPAGVERLIGMQDCRTYYTFPQKYGWYTTEVRVPLETFPGFLSGMPVSNFVNIDDPGKVVFDPLVSNKARFEIQSPVPVVKNSVLVNLSLMQIGPGTKPVMQRKSLENSEVRLFKQTAIPQDFLPVNWKVYGAIWANVKPVTIQLTNATGNASFSGITQDAYLILAECPVSSSQNYVGSYIASNDPGWKATSPIQVALRMLQTPTGTNPGKTTKVTGSELLITSPEFVEWDARSEAYAFAFESSGAWQVSTSVTPPTGFKVDYKSLDVTLNNEVKTVQFVVTDVGSKWVETIADLKVTHARKTAKLTVKIGIKLNKELAKTKKTTIYGDTGVPGPFVGGRNVKDKTVN
jgi:hypothetical protein